MTFQNGRSARRDRKAGRIVKGAKFRQGIRGHIDELFASDKQLPVILEQVARLGAQLLMQAALEAGHPSVRRARGHRICDRDIMGNRVRSRAK